MNSAVESVAAFRAEPAAEAVASKAKILLVDDEPKSLFALQELLSTLGENLMIAQSGEEALRLALKNDFAVILLDVRMPGIDGFETARLIRSRERSGSLRRTCTAPMWPKCRACSASRLTARSGR